MMYFPPSDAARRLVASNHTFLVPDFFFPEVENVLWKRLCQGEYYNMEFPWLRWWDLQGNLLLTGEERADRLTAQLRRREAACR